MRRVTLLCVALLGAGVLSTAMAANAGAAACTMASGSGACTIGTSTNLEAGTLTVEATPTLYWDLVGNGYDQWASASAAAPTGCSATVSGTTCSGGTASKLTVLDGSGSGVGWALSEYVSGANLPTGSVLNFNGVGSTTIGDSTVAPVGTDPFAATTPSTTCDLDSTCTVPAVATTCAHAPLGFTSCPTYPAALALTGGSASQQTDLYSAKAGTGMGAICFASGTVTSANCTGATQDANWVLGVPANALIAGTPFTGAVINVAVSSGP